MFPAKNLTQNTQKYEICCILMSVYTIPKAKSKYDCEILCCCWNHHFQSCLNKRVKCNAFLFCFRSHYAHCDTDKESSLILD